MNPELKVLELIKNAPHHPGRQEPPTIFRSKQVIASHVLEIKTSSGLSEYKKRSNTKSYQGRSSSEKMMIYSLLQYSLSSP